MTATTAITIYVNEDDPYNTGWLSYLLGLPRPDPEADPLAVNGWDMGAETPTLKAIRAVFHPANINYAVSLRRPKPPEPRKVVTNVGPDQQAEAHDIAKEHAAKVAGVEPSE